MNRIILVTGSNGGIGYELVKLLAQQGNTVYLASRTESNGKEAQARLKAEDGLEVKYVQLDVTNDESISRARHIILANEGKLDVLVNNAGIPSAAYSKASEVTIDNLESVLRTNYFGTVRVTTAFYPLLRQSKAGVIVNVSSELGSNTLQGNPKTAVPGLLTSYGTSKAVLNAYTTYLAREAKEDGIRVNAVSPGWTQTKLTGQTGGQTPLDGAKVLLPWVVLEPGDERTGMFWGPSGELPW
ncbi:hypothetical protein VNI00_008124 [Paramarasmius palmivorus]|uniref:NAD(P)-binding protein n=1 Tax=Paramarasmius palmivorus TaxID=297713 RepID=A0AAW0CXF8_9AGAR